MGSKVSKPARKLAASTSRIEPLAKVSHQKVQLPSAELKARNESNTSETKATPPTQNPSVVPRTSGREFNGFQQDYTNIQNIPEGKDGMDPQADQKYIDLITDLGRQIQTKNMNSTTHQADVTALKQLLNRKKLHMAGQSEVQAQIDAKGGTRTMINPKTLTAVIDAMNGPGSSRNDILEDFQLHVGFLDNLERFKVAHNVVMIEEHADEDQIGPIKGRRPKKELSEEDIAEPNSEDFTKSYSDNVNIKDLKKRLD